MLLGVTEADGFAIAMIAILALSFSFILVILIGIIRQARNAPTETDELLDEIHRENQAQTAGDAREKVKKEPWERKSDWWKNSS